MKKKITLSIDVEDKIAECKEIIEANKSQSSAIEELRFRFYTDQLAEYEDLLLNKGMKTITKVVDNVKPRLKNYDY